MTWSSDNTDVATVDANGKVSAVGAGSATITATATNGTEDTSDDKADYCTVIVKYPFTAESITIADFTYGDTVLRDGTDYVLDVKEGDIASATNAGTYTFSASGRNSYSGENVVLTWKINKAPFKLTGASLTCNREPQNLISGDVPAGTKFSLTAPQAGLDYETESTKIGMWVRAIYDKAYNPSSPEEGEYYYSAMDVLHTYEGALYYLNDKDESEAAKYISYALSDVGIMAQSEVTPSDDVKEAIDYINTYVKDTTLEKTKARFDTVEPEWNETITATNAGDYTVYYKGSGNYDDTVKSVTASIAKAPASPEAVTGLTAAYGKTLAYVTLPDGWAWDAPATSVGNVGNNTFAATYTPTDTDNYNTLNQNLTVNVVAVDKTSLNEAIAAANKYLATIQKTVYADPALALISAITDAKAVAENDNVTEKQVAQAIIDMNNAVTTAKAAVKDIDDTKAAQATAEKAAVDAKTAQAKAEEDAATAKTAQATAEKAAADAKTAQTKAEEEAAAAKTAQANAEKAKEAAETALANAEKDAAAKVAAAQAAQKTAETAQATAEKAAADAKTAQTKAEEEAAAAKTAQADAEKAQAAAEEAQKEAVEAQSAAEALAKQAEAEKEAAEKKAAEEKAAADKAAADKVIEKINEIGKVNNSNASENKIIAARSAYDTLTDDQKALVTNYDVLTKAESDYDALPQTGMSGFHKVFAGLAAIMGITGIGLIKKSRKEYDDE